MKKTRFFASALFVSAVLSFAGTSIAQTTSTETNDESGSICVLPNSPEPPTRISPGGEYNPDTLTVRIDKRDSVLWPHKNPVLIEGLHLQEHHLVVLASDGRRIQSFRFKFSEYHDTRLCIYFDGYEGVQLGNRRDALWCKVKTHDCWR